MFVLSMEYLMQARRLTSVCCVVSGHGWRELRSGEQLARGMLAGRQHNSATAARDATPGIVECSDRLG